MSRLTMMALDGRLETRKKRDIRISTNIMGASRRNEAKRIFPLDRGSKPRAIDSISSNTVGQSRTNRGLFEERKRKEKKLQNKKGANGHRTGAPLHFIEASMSLFFLPLLGKTQKTRVCRGDPGLRSRAYGYVALPSLNSRCSNPKTTLKS